jgi:serine protease Do
MKLAAAFCAVVAVLAVPGRLMADSVVLRDGSAVVGTILAEKESELIVDIGIDILRIPRDRIVEYKTAGPADVNNVGDSRTAAPPASGQFYRTGDLKESTIEKCVEAFAEAVVMISSPAGMGSGFFINEQGYLITNYHVIERETKIEVTVFQKTPLGLEKTRFKKVKIEAINPFVDLALLRVEDVGDFKVRYAYLGDTDRLQVGERVFAVGNPMGLERTVSQGIISTRNRAFEGLVYLQTTAAINPGNSGGPLFNLAGEVVGVTNMGYIFLGGLGFAIPADYVKKFLDNRDAFTYDPGNPNTGYKYLQPPPCRGKNIPQPGSADKSSQHSQVN